MKSIKMRVGQLILSVSAVMSVPAQAADITLPSPPDPQTMMVSDVAGRTNRFFASDEADPDSLQPTALMQWGSDGVTANLGFAGTLIGKGNVQMMFRAGDGRQQYLLANVNLTGGNFTDFTGQLMVCNLWDNDAKVKVSGDGLSKVHYLFGGVSRDRGYTNLRGYGNSERGSDTLHLMGDTTLAGVTGVAKGKGYVSVANINAKESITAETDAAFCLNLTGAGKYAFYGSVGASDKRISLNKSGTGSQVLGGANFFQNVQISGGTVELGTTAVAGDFTTMDGTTVVLCGASTDTPGLTVAGTATLAEGTAWVFDLPSLAEGDDLGIKLISAEGVSADGLTVRNLRINGEPANQRGVATFEVVDNVLTLKSYTVGANLVLTWNGGDNGVWKANGAGWLDAEGQSANFQVGDSAVFAAGDAVKTVKLEGRVSEVGTLTVTDGYTFTTDDGVEATIVLGTAAPAGLTVGAGASLSVGAGITLDLGTLTGNIAYSSLSGEGTLKLVTGLSNHGRQINLGNFAGTVDYNGNFNANTFGSGRTATIKLSNGTFYHKVTKRILPQTFVFLTDYGTDSASDEIEFTGPIQAAGKRFDVNSTVVFTNESAVTREFGMLVLSNSGIVKQQDGVVNVDQLRIHGAQGQTRETYEISGGVLNVTHGDETAEKSPVVIGHYHNGLESKLKVSGGVVNVLSGQILIGWDSKAVLEIAGGELNALRVVKPTAKPNTSAEVLLTGGRLNIGVGGIWAYAGTLQMTADGGTFGAFADSWSMDANQNFTVGQNGVVFDTQKRTVSASGASEPVAEAASTITINAAIGDRAEDNVGAVSKIGSGTLVLNGASAYTGTTSIQEGTVKTGSLSAFGTSAVSVASGATVNILNEMGEEKLLATGRFTIDPGAVIQYQNETLARYVIRAKGLYKSSYFIILVK